MLLEHLPLPLQSESEPQWPQEPLEHLPKPAQSESEPQLDIGCPVVPNTAAGESSVMVAASCVVADGSNAGTGTAVTFAWSLAPQAEIRTRQRMSVRIPASYHRPRSRRHVGPASLTPHTIAHTAAGSQNTR